MTTLTLEGMYDFHQRCLALGRGLVSVEAGTPDCWSPTPARGPGHAMPHGDPS